MTITVEIKQDNSLICWPTFQVTSRQDLKNQVIEYMDTHYQNILKYTFFIKEIN